MLKIIAVVALMIQSYLVTEDENKSLNSNKEVFQWLVEILDYSVRAEFWNGSKFSVVEVIRVRSFLLLKS